MSKSKRLITASAIALIMASSYAATNFNTVLAESDSSVTTASDTYDAKLKKAIAARDEVYKKFSTEFFNYLKNSNVDSISRNKLIAYEKDLRDKEFKVFYSADELNESKGSFLIKQFSTFFSDELDKKESDKTQSVRIRFLDDKGSLLGVNKIDIKDDDASISGTIIPITNIDGYEIVGSGFISDKDVVKVGSFAENGQYSVSARDFKTKSNGTLNVIFRKKESSSTELDKSTEGKTDVKSTIKDDKNPNADVDLKFNFNGDGNKSSVDNGGFNFNVGTPDDSKSDKNNSNSFDFSSISSDKKTNEAEKVKSETKTDDNKDVTKSTDESNSDSGKTTIDGIITKMKFNETGQGIRFSALIDHTKLKDGQKLEGDYAVVKISSGDGKELGSFDVHDYKVDGLLNSTPKSGDILIVKYGGQYYELPYDIAAENKLKETNSSDKSDSKSSEDKKVDKKDAKAGLLPSTGQKNTMGAFIAGLVMILVGSGTLFMKFRNKKSED